MNYKLLFSYISTFRQGSFRIYEITEEEHKKAEKEHPALLFRNLPSNDVEKVIVRLYVIAVRSLLCFISLLRPCLALVIELCCPLAQYFHTDILHLHGNFSVYESKVFFICLRCSLSDCFYQGINLTPLDLGGSVDPYLYVKCGKEIKSDKSNYLTRQINPEFGKYVNYFVVLCKNSPTIMLCYRTSGLNINILSNFVATKLWLILCRMFEFVAQLPRDSLLNITVYDHDMIGSDDIVGSTIIDLEDRFLTWKHASCGVAKQYIV